MHWPGIEPGPPAWQARILPLNHQCPILRLFSTIVNQDKYEESQNQCVSQYTTNLTFSPFF